jgi:hypothetical protein
MTLPVLSLSQLRTMQTTRLLLAFVLVSAASAQSSTNTKPTTDESLIDRPNKEIDFPGCYSDLVKADRDGDGFVKQKEYLNFIQEYGKRICFSTNALTLQQSATFNTLACICRSQDNAADDCCLGKNAQIPTSGANMPVDKQSPNQKNYLTSVCKLTDATIDGQCPPAVRDRATPPEALVAPVPAGSGDGLMWGLIAGALALALLLCCCCCVVRRKRMKQAEEEEEAARQAANAAKAEPLSEQAPALPPGPHLLRKTGIDPEKDPRGMNLDDPDPENPGGVGKGARGSAVADDDDEDEDGRKRRGGGLIPPGDEESGLRIPAAPRLPPPMDPNNPGPKLRPIPPKEGDEDEWDHPGRNIEFPRDKDEMSAGEVDHYEPDGGLKYPDREGRDPLNRKKDWNRQKPEEPDEVDPRKHRIQSGLGEGEVWDKLGEEETEHSRQKPQGDMFDWVMQTALGVLDKNTPSGNANGRDDRV